VMASGESYSDSIFESDCGLDLPIATLNSYILVERWDHML
jgi:hypothetical protein